MEYIRDVELNIKNNPKYFWEYIKSKRKQSHFPANMSYNSLKSSDPQQVCNMFAEFFESAFSGDITSQSIEVEAFFLLIKFHVF